MVSELPLPFAPRKHLLYLLFYPLLYPVTPRRSLRPESAAPPTRAVDVSPAAPVTKEQDPPSAAPAPAETPVVAAPVAVAPAPAPEPPPTPAAPKWRDGTYTGWGTSRHGDIEARVVIKDGRIVESGIAQCLTRYSCDVIDAIIPQPVQLQSPNIGFVSRATESADAYYYALVDALGKARPATVTRTEAVMGTLVSIQVDAPAAVVERAFGWFLEIEEHCSRFSSTSELRQLTPGKATPASPILFEAVRFALLVSEETNGAFDPTVGHQMAERGFNRHHRTGEVATGPGDDRVSFRDVEVDAENRTILLRRPLTLDLGAVAKGLAVDAAARELEPFRNFAIDAGGDLYFGGLNPQGEPWSVGIRHPRNLGELIDRLRLSNQAICTSGDYERGPHILDPRTNAPATAVASATVVAPKAMLADALATAAFVLGPEQSIPLLTRLGVEGLIVTTDLQRYQTAGLCHA
ncbi:MAG: FAD:protein FMN transferase [Acidobacteriota bacterium]